MTEKKTFYGLIKVVEETGTGRSHEEYIGLRDAFLLGIAIIYGAKKDSNGESCGLLMDGQYVFWHPDIGFYHNHDNPQKIVVPVIPHEPSSRLDIMV